MNSLKRIMAVALMTAATARGADFAADWDPENTWVFAVGILQWQHADIWSSFPAAMKNRRDEQLVEFFRASGVPDDQIVYLQDAQATKKRIERKLGELLDETDDEQLLVFYYAGHGYRDEKTGETWFANYDAGKRDGSAWNVRGAVKTILDRFSGNRVLLLADCCHSGALYDEAAKKRGDGVALAAITSAYSHNLSTGNWTFTDSLLAGLRGSPVVDIDADGVVELNELAKYAELEMAFVEGQKSMFIAADDFPSDAKLVASQGTAKPRVGERVEALWKDQWYKARVIDADDGQLKIHYVDYDDSWDEWAPPNRLRPYAPREFVAGAKVQVYSEDDGDWYPATVRQAWYGLHFIHYDGYADSWDEWVGPSAIKPAE